MGKRRFKKSGYVDYSFLDARKQQAESKGFPEPKYIQFCRSVLDMKLRVHLHESKTTRSKYVTITSNKGKFKVRFSNHKPNKGAQEREDSNFYVGVSNGVVTTTDQALEAVKNWAGL